MSSDVTIVSLNINMIKAVIFDMDGVIIDSEPIYAKWLSMFLQSRQVEVSEDELRTIPGISSQNFKKKLEKWWADSGKPYTPGTQINIMFEEYSDKFSLHYIDILNPHVRDVMEWLKKSHFKVAVASSSSMDNITQVLSETGIDKYVDIKVSGENFIKSKPDPEIYNFTLNKLGLLSEECIAIEDSTYGIKAAAGAGIKVIAKNDDRFGFDQTSANYHVDNLSQVIDIIKNIN